MANLLDLLSVSQKTIEQIVSAPPPALPLFQMVNEDGEAGLTVSVIAAEPEPEPLLSSPVLPVSTVVAQPIATNAIRHLDLSDLARVGYFTRPTDVVPLEVLTGTANIYRVALLEGQPGVGKTMFAESVVRGMTKAGTECGFVPFQMHARVEDRHLFSVPNAQAIAVAMATGKIEDIERLTIKGCLANAALASLRGPVVLLIDELDKTVPPTENMLLSFMDNGRVQLEEGDIYADLSRLMVIATSNGARELEDQTLRRFFRHTLVYLPEAEEKKLLRSRTGQPSAAINSVSELAKHIRGRSAQVSIKEMSNVLELAQKMPTSDAMVSLVVGYMVRRPGDADTDAISECALTLWNAYAKPA